LPVNPKITITRIPAELTDPDTILACLRQTVETLTGGLSLQTLRSHSDFGVYAGRPHLVEKVLMSDLVETVEMLIKMGDGWESEYPLPSR